MGATQNAVRDQAIVAAGREGKTLREIGVDHGISHQRARQILKYGPGGETLSRLPGSEDLSPITRGLLIRLGYSSATAVAQAVKSGKLHDGCAFGMGSVRFSEIANWVRTCKEDTRK